MSMQSMRFVLVTVSLLLAVTCINRQSVVVNCLIGQLPTISTLLVIGCLQTRWSFASHVSSASSRRLHRYASVLVGVGILGQHVAEAKREVVTDRSFKNTSYYGSPVSLQNDAKTQTQNILITLDKDADRTNITWRFKGEWLIVMEKCDNISAEIEISSNSCNWRFDWEDMRDLRLISNDTTVNTWPFPGSTKRPKPHTTKLRIVVGTSGPGPTMNVYPNDSMALIIQSDTSAFCMLDTEDLVNVELTEKKCSVSVTIMNAELLYDFPEPTTMPPTAQNYTGNTTSSPWNGNATMPTTDMDSASESYVLYYAIGGGVGGFLLLAAVVGGVIAFICIRGRRRRRQQEHYDDDADPKISKQIVKEEGLIEWTDLMTHAPYYPTENVRTRAEDWPYVSGDTVDLSSIAASEISKVKFKELEFKGNIKGTEDYGVVEGRFDPKDKTKGVNRQASIYYSFPFDRTKACIDRLSRLTELYQPGKDAADEAYKEEVKKVEEENKKRKEENKKKNEEHEDKPPPPKPYFPLLRVPQLRYFWISPDPKKFSYLVVHYHGRPVAQVVKEGVPFHMRVGYAFTTFVALTSIHRLGCVHRDVTPAAFVVRNEVIPDLNFVYITHLSVSRFQYNIADNTWRPRRRVVEYFGTHKYASRAAHAQQERSFKDDVESWFYTAIELIWPTKDDRLVMPWHLFNTEIGLTEKPELHKKYMAAKDKFLRTFGQNKIFVAFPAAQFRVFAEEILKMTFETLESDYGRVFIGALYVMIEQLPTQADEASHQAVLDLIWNLNEFECHADDKFNFGPGPRKKKEEVKDSDKDKE